MIWAARTVTGMIFVIVDPDDREALAGAELVVVQNDAGDRVAARMIGPVADAKLEVARWRVDARYRTDSEGVPLNSIAPATEPAEPVGDGHDWGALGLPAGLDTRVQRADAPLMFDELLLARQSHGYRSGEESLLLRLSPGDQVRVGDVVGTVLAVDRRKRTVEVDTSGDVMVVAFDDIRTQEAT